MTETVQTGPGNRENQASLHHNILLDVFGVFIVVGFGLWYPNFLIDRIEPNLNVWWPRIRFYIQTMWGTALIFPAVYYIFRNVLFRNRAPKKLGSRSGLWGIIFGFLVVMSFIFPISPHHILGEALIDILLETLHLDGVLAAPAKGIIAAFLTIFIIRSLSTRLAWEQQHKKDQKQNKHVKSFRLLRK